MRTGRALPPWVKKALEEAEAAESQAAPAVSDAAPYLIFFLLSQTHVFN